MFSRRTLAERVHRKGLSSKKTYSMTIFIIKYVPVILMVVACFSHRPAAVAFCFCPTHDFTWCALHELFSCFKVTKLSKSDICGKVFWIDSRSAHLHWLFSIWFADTNTFSNYSLSIAGKHKIMIYGGKYIVYIFFKSRNCPFFSLQTSIRHVLVNFFLLSSFILRPVHCSY